MATASPPHRVSQGELREFARRVFADAFADIDERLAVFENSGVRERQLARPLGWYEVPRSFPEKNEVYRQSALELAITAADAAMCRAAIAPTEIGAVVFVTTSGISTPSLDGALIAALDLPRTAARVPLWGLGCAGGAAGLARAAELAYARGRPVLLVAVEILSATFVRADRSKSSLVATSLFGDGAAAVVVTCGGEGLPLLAGHSLLLDDTRDVMGWTLVDGGLQVVFAATIPELVREALPRLRGAAAAAAAVEPAAIEHLVMHPGGAKVLAAYETGLQAPRERFQASRDVLREHGNMSSPTVLFVLDRFMRSTPPSGALGMAAALGPGFAAEGVTFRW